MISRVLFIHTDNPLSVITHWWVICVMSQILQRGLWVLSVCLRVAGSLFPARGLEALSSSVLKSLVLQSKRRSTHWLTIIITPYTFSLPIFFITWEKNQKTRPKIEPELPKKISEITFWYRENKKNIRSEPEERTKKPEANQMKYWEKNSEQKWSNSKVILNHFFCRKNSTFRIFFARKFRVETFWNKLLAIMSRGGDNLQHRVLRIKIMFSFYVQIMFNHVKCKKYIFRIRHGYVRDPCTSRYPCARCLNSSIPPRYMFVHAFSTLNESWFRTVQGGSEKMPQIMAHNFEPPIMV